MAWTRTQKQIAARACHAAGIDEDQRRDVILRNFDHAKLPDGRISSTSPKLTNHDFEAFMAIVERYAGGQLLHFSRGYWQRKSDDHYQRMRHKAAAILAALTAAGTVSDPDAFLSGWIEKRVSAGATDRIEALDYHGLLALITGLSAYARQNQVELPK